MASPRKTKRYWTEEESELLRKSVSKYGGHKWALILKNEPLFSRNGRNQVDLKDRWRNMNRKKSRSPRKSPRRIIASNSLVLRSPRRTIVRRSRSPTRLIRSPRRKSRSRSLSPVNDFVIYTIDNCGYCADIKSYLNKSGIFYREIKVTNSNKDVVYKKTDPLTKKYRYFPMIFINGKFIGGYTEFQKLYGIK